MKKFTFLFVTSAFISAFYLKPLLAQTELMKDVDAVDEKSEDDLYAPEDEAATPDSKSASNSKEKKAPPKVEAPPPTEEAIMKVAPTLDELPVTTKPKTAMTGVLESSESAQLTSIKSYAMDDRVRYEIQTSRVVDFAPETSNSTKKFTLNLADTTIGPLVSKSPVKADSSNSPVDKFQATESKSEMGNYTQVIMDLNTLTEPVIRREGNRLLLDFFTNKAGPYLRTETKLSAELPSYETLISLDSKSNFVGSKVNFNAKDASIPSVLQFISQVSGKNFVLVGEADRKISINVKSVPWDQVLAFVLLNAELGYQKIGNTYRVMPISKIRSDISETLRSQEEEYKLQAKATQLFPLSYAKASETLGQITRLIKSDYGESALSDERTNSIVITALPKNIQRVRKFLEAVDKQTPVVEIEARIVQATKSFTQKLGVNWKSFGTFSIANGKIGLGGGIGTTTKIEGRDTTPTGGIGGSYSGTSGSLQALDALLLANENAANTKLLSRPSLTVLNNKQASLTDGSETTVILQGNATEASTSKSITANLGLNVTPQVTNDNNILLNIQLNKDTPGAPSADNKIFTTDRKQISTQTLVESGKTVVLGGVYSKKDINADDGIPFLRKLPFFGSFFTSNRTKTNDESEILMFISPRILNLDKASINQQTLEEAR
ncbi:MAG: secretin N-terminal domain-containing protein [bacterium]